jgi:four helix bundle protein
MCLIKRTENKIEIEALYGLLSIKSIFLFEFRKLTVYSKAKEFHHGCKALILGKNFDLYVIDQLGRASFSVPLNIAEGSGKFSKADRRNFFVISRASLFECVAILDIQNDHVKITQDEFDFLCFKADELSRMLYSMIKNLSN